MGDEGLVADNQMLSSVARAISIAQGGTAATADLAASPRPSDRLVTSPRRDSTTAGTSSSLLKIVPSDVWVMHDWQWAQHAKNTLYRRKYVSSSSADGSVISNSRSMTAAYPRPSLSQHGADKIKSLQIPPSSGSGKSTNGAASGIDRFVDWLLGTNGHTSPRDRANSSAASSPKSVPGGDKMPSAEVSSPAARPPMMRRSSRGLGLKSIEFPKLKWKWAPNETFDQASIHWASKKLSRQMAVAENLLVGMFPSLCIDLQNPLGMSCPNATCTLKRPLTLEEIYEGWEEGDPNKYTTKCPTCAREFVPRFTVMCRSKSWVGSEGPKTPLWCELLSPWTLRKELFTVLFEEGVEHIISPSFRHPTLSPQHCVLFWNALISFRLQGLPYSFLLCGRSITSAFPPNNAAPPAPPGSAPGSSSGGDRVIPHVSPVMRPGHS